MHAHLSRDDPRKRRLSQTRRAVQQHMVQRLSPVLRRPDIDVQHPLKPLLADIFLQRMGTQIPFYMYVLFRKIGRDHPFFHVFDPSARNLHMLQRRFDQLLCRLALGLLYRPHRIRRRVAQSRQRLYRLLSRGVRQAPRRLAVIRLQPHRLL